MTARKTRIIADLKRFTPRLRLMDALARPLTEALSAREDVLFAYLFGSQASGRAHPRSDVDLAVWLSEPYDRASFAPLLGLIGAATGALRRDDVDVVILNEAPLRLAFEILGGKLLFSRDEDTRIRAEAAIMSRYHDRLPYYKRHLDHEARMMSERGFS